MSNQSPFACLDCGATRCMLHMRRTGARGASCDGSMSAPLPLIVGEDNPLSRDPKYALFCAPRNSAGWRLCHLVMGLHRWRYLKLPRVDLCKGKWSMPEARDHAAYLLSGSGCGDDAAPSVFVLLGRKVTTAFEQPLGPFETRRFPNGFTYIALPHPSGRCRVWQEPGAFERTRALLRKVCPEVPWGEAIERRTG